MARNGNADIVPRLTTLRVQAQRLAPPLVLVLLAGAAWVLRDVTRQYNYHEVIGHLRDIPAVALARAAVLTLASYGVLTLYDVLALAYVGRSLAYGRVTSRSTQAATASSASTSAGASRCACTRSVVRRGTRSGLPLRAMRG